MAREIEDRLSLERGWMDNPISAAEQAETGNQRAKIAQLMDSLPEDQLAVALRLLMRLRNQPKAMAPRADRQGVAVVLFFPSTHHPKKGGEGHD